MSGNSQNPSNYSLIRKGIDNLNQYHDLFLQAHVGIVLFKGVDLVIHFANEPIRKIWGKDSSVIGKTLLEVLPEISQTEYPKLLLEVYRTGNTHYAYENSATLIRNGKPELVFFNFVYQPWYDANNDIMGVMAISNEVTDQVSARKQAEENEKNFRDLVMQADVATAIYYGPDMIIQMANDSMIKVWGKDNSVIGKSLQEALPELQDQPFFDLLKTVYRTGNTYKATEDRADLIVDGKLQTFYFNFSYKALRNASGEIFGILNMAVDVTEQVLSKRKLAESEEKLIRAVEERTHELKESNENLVFSNQELERFAHVASHDMKEPVRKITMFIRMLEEELRPSLSEKQIVLLDKVSKSAVRLNNIVDGVLEYSRVNAYNGEMQQVDLRDLITKIENDLEISIAEKKAVIEKFDLPVIKGYDFLLFQLFYNLISNALKFSIDGVNPRIEIYGGEPVYKNFKQFIPVVVSDNGIGFNSEYSELIFNKFTRLHSKDHYEGTGLGLSLCKTIAERHGGWIEADGAENDGAKFTVYLPV